ncbi:hypothetical protein ACXN5S_12380 [Pseudoroseicyclus sp. H15]
MQNRQRGTMSMVELMDGLGKFAGIRPMVIEAFEQPRYQSEDAQEIATEEFTNAWALRCYQGEVDLATFQDEID